MLRIRWSRKLNYQMFFHKVNIKFLSNIYFKEENSCHKIFPSPDNWVVFCTMKKAHYWQKMTYTVLLVLMSVCKKLLIYSNKAIFGSFT